MCHKIDHLKMSQRQSLRSQVLTFHFSVFSFKLLLYLKLILAYATKGAYIIIGEILECYTRLNSLLGITNLGVIHPLTYCTDILFHNYPDFNIKQSLGNICSCMEFVKVHALFVSNANLTHLIKKQQSALLNYFNTAIIFYLLLLSQASKVYAERIIKQISLSALVREALKIQNN